MIRFEKVSRFKDIDITIPKRKTISSAGYDLEVAEEIIPGVTESNFYTENTPPIFRKLL